MIEILRFLSMSAAVALFAIAGTARAADMPVKALPVVTGPAVIYFGGAAISPHSWFSDIGAVWAINRNLNVDGPLVRIRGGTGEYSYLVAPGVKNGGDFHLGEVMVGYQKFIGGVRYSGYIGAQVQDHNNDSDPNPKVDGTKWGVTAQGEIFAPFGDRGYAFVLGQISSAWTSYFVLGKLGYRVSSTLSVGPEVAALGNDRFDAQRVGLFAAFDVSPNMQFIASGGFHWQDEKFRDGDGGYGTIHVRILY